MSARWGAAFAAVAMLAGGAAAQDTGKLTDPQIAHFAYTAGVIDIEAAKLAVAKSKSKVIVAFAKDMLRDHAAVNKQALALVASLKIKPEDNDNSREEAKAAADKRAELTKLSGAAFDKAYIDNEVDYHKDVNKILETLLIPQAANPKLKAFLQTGLKIFQGHQQHAEQVAATVK